MVTALTTLQLFNNRISDVSPLASLTQLNRLDLSRNQIVDISPLMALPLGRLSLDSNPLNCGTQSAGIAAMQAGGTLVESDCAVGAQ